MIAEYSFLPWLRRGLGNRIQTPAAAASRARLTVDVTVASDLATQAIPQKQIELIGPGDILGINSQVVVRTEPRPWITDFEPNYLAFVEFYDEDFVWRYTPQSPDAAQHRLDPWLTLVVLEETEFERDQRPGRPLTSIKLKAGVPLDKVFPPDTQLWAWAHVHLNESLGSGTTPNLEQLDVLLRNDPDKGYCRLFCPRRLAPDTGYCAFVIPTFEPGRKAGLGEPVADADPGLAIAWRVATEFPVYYEWYFRTGVAGDFEELVRALVPRAVDRRVGVRDLDVQQPGFGMPPIQNAPDDVVGLEGALKAPTTERKPLAEACNFPAEIQRLVNLAADAADDGVPGGSDPVVSVPLYGRWHAMVERIDTAPAAGTTPPARWVDELNGDPRERAAAGMGTAVVQANQEQYVRLAWQQIGEVLAANRKIREAQAAMLASRAIYTKYLATLPDVRVLPIVASTMRKVMGSPVTMHHLVRESVLPAATLSGPLRKQLRPRGMGSKRLLAAAPRAAAGPAAGQPAGPATGQATRQALLARVIAEVNAGRASAAPARGLPGGPTLEAATGALAPREPDEVRWVLTHRRPIAVVVLALLVLLAIAARTPGIVVLVVGAIALAVAYGPIERWQGTLRAIDLLAPAGLTAPVAAAAPPHPTFQLLRPGEPPPALAPAPAGNRTDGPTAAAFRQAATELHALLALAPPPLPARAPLALTSVHRKMMQALEPGRTFAARFAPQLRVGAESALAYVTGFYRDRDLPDDSVESAEGAEDAAVPHIAPILAYPDIKQPMYEPLRDLSADLFVPNLNLIPPNTISLMVTNQRFIEAYMVGLNHEFARELLWREYPTDQRGSSFRQFWDPANNVNRDNLPPKDFAEKVRDIPPIHTWDKVSLLGQHDHRDAQGDRTQLVLVIRGDLLKRYPNTIIHAQAATWGTRAGDELRLVLWDESGERTEQDPDDRNIRFPLYRAQVQPDIHFIGFDLTLDEARGHPDLAETAAAKATIPAQQLGWFFVIQEVVGEPRFGLDEHAPPVPGAVRWDNLSWDALGADVQMIDLTKPFATLPPGSDGGLAWGANAADQAAILYQKPVLVAVHARDMLAKLEAPPG